MSRVGRVLGVDACKKGWVGVVLDDGVTAVFAVDLSGLVAAAEVEGPVAVVAIDMPIGVPDRGRRRADVCARAFVGPRRNSVFMTPVRAALMADSYAQAQTANRQGAGEGISQQAWALRPKVLALEAWAARTERTVIEIHPEVSFAVIAGHPLADPKSTWAGARAREALLAVADVSLPADLGTAGRIAGVDDVLDAAVAAWSARRYHTGEAISLPDPPEILADGRPCAIWA
jgi:predicted RNase H-like nuclease